MAKMQSPLPARKVWAATLANAITSILIYFLNTYALPEPIPSGVQGSILTVITFIVGYFVPPAHDDNIVSA
jgi:hypothetical protein